MTCHKTHTCLADSGGNNWQQKINMRWLKEIDFIMFSTNENYLTFGMSIASLKSL